MKPNGDPKNTSGDTGTDSWLELVRREVSSLDFGVVQIVAHGARVFRLRAPKKYGWKTPLHFPIEQINSFADQTPGGMNK